MYIAAITYLLLFLFWIYKTGFSGLLTDNKISSAKFTFLFFLKSLAIPAFILVYKKMYGGIEKFDAGIFYNDAKALNTLAYLNFPEFLKSIIGLQDDNPGSYFYDHCIIYTQNWDNGRLKDFFFNDNRIVIRLHAILHFIAFDSYAVHALFNCFISYIGLFYIYRSFKEFFKGKEVLLFVILCLFPALWFYTGAVLKEGLVIFVLGAITYQLKKIAHRNLRLKNFVWLGFLLFISALLKPYLLCYAVFCFSLFFYMTEVEKIKYKLIYFLSVTVILFFSLNAFFYVLKNKSVKEMALAQQRIFSDASKGGIFLLDSVKFVRLSSDTSLIIKKPGRKTYSIRKNAPYIYWEHSHQQDTLVCVSNIDTLGQYQLVYQISEGGSNIGLGEYSKHRFSFLSSALYYGLFFPLFLNAKGPLQIIASFENLAIIFSIVIILWGFLKSTRDRFLPFVFTFFAVTLCILIGITTPNSGAIFRYRSPVVIFILMAALYYIQAFKVNFNKRSN